MKFSRSRYAVSTALTLAIALGVFAFFAKLYGPGVAFLGFLALNGAAYGLTLSPKLGVANSLGTLAALKIIMQRAFQLTFTRFPAVRLFAMGFKELDGKVQTMGLGQTAVSKLRVVSTAGNFGDVATAFNMTDAGAMLRNWPQISHSFTAEEINQIQAGQLNLLDLAAMPMAVAMAKTITTRVASFVSKTNFDTTTNSIAPTLTVAAAWSRANTVVPMRTACNDRGIPENPAMPGFDPGMPSVSNRYFLFNSTVDGALQLDPLIVAEQNNPANQLAIQRGILPRVSGFEMMAYPLIPNSDGNLIGFAGTPDALGYVGRAPITPWDLLPDLPKTALMSIVTDETTGFSALLIIEGVVGSLSVNIRLIWLDGVAVGNPNNLVRLINGTVTGTAGTVVSGVVTNPGYGYRDGNGTIAAPTVVITAASGDVTGSGATATCTVSTGGAVTGITITGAGTLYTKPPIISFTPNTTGGAGTVTAAATASVGVGGLS